MRRIAWRCAALVELFERSEGFAGLGRDRPGDSGLERPRQQRVDLGLAAAPLLFERCLFGLEQRQPRLRLDQLLLHALAGLVAGGGELEETVEQGAAAGEHVEHGVRVIELVPGGLEAGDDRDLDGLILLPCGARFLQRDLPAQAALAGSGQGLRGHEAGARHGFAAETLPGQRAADARVAEGKHRVREAGGLRGALAGGLELLARGKNLRIAREGLFNQARESA